MGFASVYTRLQCELVHPKLELVAAWFNLEPSNLKLAITLKPKSLSPKTLKP